MIRHFFLRLPVVIVLSIAGFLFYQQGIKEWNRAREMDRVPVVPVADVLLGRVQVEGIVAATDGQTLVSPIQEKKCLGYILTVSERQENKWRVVRTSKKVAPFYLQDDTGKILVQPGENLPLELNRTFSERRGNQLFTEYLLEPGMAISVVGIGKSWGPGTGHIDFDAPADQLNPRISTQNLTHLQARHHWVSLACLLGLLGCVISILAIWTANFQLQTMIGFLTVQTIGQGVALLLLGQYLIQSDHRIAVLTLENDLGFSQTVIKSVLALHESNWDGAWVTLPAALQNANLAPQTKEVGLRLLEQARQRVVAYQSTFATAPERWIVQPVSYPGLASLGDSFTFKSRQSLLWWQILFGLGMGALLLLFGCRYGFKEFFFKRAIDNLPSTALAGITYGLNHIIAKPCTDKLQEGPISKQPAVLLRHMVKVPHKNSWSIRSDTTEPKTFYLAEGNKRLAVTHEGAWLYLTQLISEKRNQNREWHQEHAIRPDDEVHILANAFIDPKTHDRLVIKKADDKQNFFLISTVPLNQAQRHLALNGFALLSIAMLGCSTFALHLSASLGEHAASSFVWAILGPLAFLGLAIAVILFNDLIFLRNRARACWANIEVALKKRLDLLNNLLPLVKTAMGHERVLQTQLSEARNKEHFTPEEAEAAECVVMMLWHGVYLHREDHPDLRSEELMQSSMQTLTELENEISLMREGYNRAVTTFNTRCQHWPELLFAPLFGFRTLKLHHQTPRPVPMSKSTKLLSESGPKV